jgi:hypothetical protein
MPNPIVEFSWHSVGLEASVHIGCVDGTTPCRSADLPDRRRNGIGHVAIQGINCRVASIADSTRWSSERGKGRTASSVITVWHPGCYV